MGGTEKATLRVVPERLYTAEMKRAAARQRSQGRQVLFFTGELEINDGSESFAARGAISADGKRMWVCADDAQASAEQIARHEEFHALVQASPALPEEVRRKILSTHGAQELRSMVEAYINEYGFSGVDDSYILEEILADAYAGIDILDYLPDFEGAPRFAGETQEAASGRTASGNSQIRGPTGQERILETQAHS